MPFDPLRLQVTPGDQEPFRHHHADAVLGFGEKKNAVKTLTEILPELRELHNRLNAQRTWSVLIILQAMDAAGKDGIIKHVLTGFNQQSCNVTSFSAPVGEELTHTFLWRCMAALPARGHIGVFNRSYYEEVLVPRVHPQYLDYQRLPSSCLAGDVAAPLSTAAGGTASALDPNSFYKKLQGRTKTPSKPPAAFWDGRLDDINAFERHLARNGTRVVKFFLHLSREEQKRRFLTRIEDSARNWKFSPSDVRDRRDWDDYHHAYAQILSSTSTPWAPWYVIPADYKYVARLAVAKVLKHELSVLEPEYPRLDPKGRQALTRARRELQREG